MSFIEREPREIIRIWLGVVIVFYTCVAVVGIEQGLSQKDLAKEKHKERISQHKTERGKTKPVWDEARLAQSNPVKVDSGIYIDRITDLSIPDAHWVVDFYIWFRWADNRVSPWDTLQIVDGEVLKYERVELDIDAKPYYALYRVKAIITKFFNATRYPRDNHLLTIRIEDRKHQVYQMQYTPDEKDSAVSSRVKLHGYEIYNETLTQKFHSYKTSRGKVHDSRVGQDTYSQLIYAIAIKRAGWGNYVKMFEGLFAAVAVSLLSFFVRTTTTNRISLGVGAFFASVAATYVASRNLPSIGVLTLTDVITGLAMVTILLVIWHTIIATRLFDLHKDEGMVHRFDMLGFVIFFSCFVATNFALALSASI